MNRLLTFFFATGIVFLFSCQKEYSVENTFNNDGSGQIIGQNCRMSKIAYYDTATKVSYGALIATINSLDIVTNITGFDSVSLTINFFSAPAYASDTVFVNSDEYFLVDITTKRVKQLHGLTDPTDPFSIQFEIFYNYSATGYLISKFYALSSSPGIPFYVVAYTYTNNNLTHMEGTELFTGDKFTDADMTYYSFILPKSYLYIFPDEQGYADYNQFFNFGKKNNNAIKSMIVRDYDPGNVLRDSAVSTFTGYIMSRDNYVLSVYMNGDDQPSIPAVASKLSFSYKCK